MIHPLLLQVCFMEDTGPLIDEGPDLIRNPLSVVVLKTSITGEPRVNAIVTLLIY